jgi:hypothetical protein
MSALLQKLQTIAGTKRDDALYEAGPTAAVQKKSSPRAMTSRRRHPLGAWAAEVPSPPWVAFSKYIAQWEKTFFFGRWSGRMRWKIRAASNTLSQSAMSALVRTKKIGNTRCI